MKTDKTYNIPTSGEILGKPEIEKALMLLEERLLCQKPYNTLEGCLNDIQGLKEIDSLLHELPEEDTEADLLIERLCAVENNLRQAEKRIRFWLLYKAA